MRATGLKASGEFVVAADVVINELVRGLGRRSKLEAPLEKHLVMPGVPEKDFDLDMVDESDETLDSISLDNAMRKYQDVLETVKSLAVEMDKQPVLDDGEAIQPAPTEELLELRQKARRKNEEMKALIDKLRFLSLHLANFRNEM